jgi:ATP-binding cassette subfamily F protein uup
VRAPKTSDASPAARSSGRDKRELEKLEKKIATLEEEQRLLHEEMADPDFWTGPADRMDATKTRLAAVEGEIEAAYGKWTALQG